MSVMLMWVTLTAGQGPAPKAALLAACVDVAVTQGALNDCAVAHRVRVERDLDEVYGRLLKAVQTEPIGTADKIRATRQAWERYRDAFLEAVFPLPDKLIEYGSMYPADFNLLKAQLTESQIADLRHMLEWYTRP